MNVVIIEVKKPISIPSSAIKAFCEDYARFCQEYHDSWVILVPEKVIWEGYASFMVNGDFDINIEKLNKFAFSRLISNLEEKHPEVSLVMMGAGEESKLFKVRERKNLNEPIY